MLNSFVRDMEEKDLSAVDEIEKLCFVAPWKKADIQVELDSNPFATLLVVEVNNQVVGFADFWVTFDSATITQIAVHPDLHHMGLGSELLEDTIATCKAKKVRTISLEVRKSNEKALGLYKKYGFNVVCIKEGYYKDHEDALYMVLEVK